MKTSNPMRNMKSIIWFGLKKNKTIFHVFDNLFDYHKNLINKIINRLNTIDSPKTYKYFVFFRFSNKHVLMEGDQNYRIWPCILFEHFRNVIPHYRSHIRWWMSVSASPCIQLYTHTIKYAHSIILSQWHMTGLSICSNSIHHQNCGSNRIQRTLLPILFFSFSRLFPP